MTNELKITEKDIERLNCLSWTERNRMVKSKVELKSVPFSISRSPYLYPFLRDIYYSKSIGGPRHVVIQKCRQIGATEFALNAAFYAMDVFSANVIYALPGQGDLRTFAGSRVNSIIRESPRIKAMFSSVDNLDVKVGRSSSLFFRGMN